MKRFMIALVFAVSLAASPASAASLAGDLGILGISYNNHTYGNISNMMYNLKHSMDDYFSDFWSLFYSF